MKQRMKFSAFNHLRRAVALLALVILTPPTAVWADWTGDGSVSNPYQIESYAQLKEFAAIVNGGTTRACAKLMDDIVCKNAPDDTDYATDWTPIGNNTHRYTGVFDGAGYTITGLSTPTDNTSNNVGLFGIVDSVGVVKNVGLKDVTLTGDGGVGGFVGENSGTVQNCCLIGVRNITATSSNVGGIVGYNSNSGTIQNCYVAISGSITTTGPFVGGIVGFNGGTVSCCYYAGTGEIGGSDNVGAIIGMNLATAEYCYYNVNNTTVIRAIGNADNTENVKGLTAAQFQDLNNFSGFSSDVWLQGVVAPLLKGMPYTISFNANGGEGSMDNQTVTSDDDDVLSANTFTRSGYHFIEWNTKVDGLGVAVATDVEARQVGPETLYAQWCANTNLTAHTPVEATCTTAGNTAYWSCSVCGKYFSDAAGTTEISANSWVIPATGHTLIKHEEDPATCTTAGSSAFWECENCHKYFSDASGSTEIAENSWEIPATGHYWGDWVVGVPASCLAAGSQYRECTSCHAHEYDDIPALGHDFVNHDAVAPTCTTAGHTAYEGCSRCDYKDGYTEIPAAPATGHNFENDECTFCHKQYAQGTCGNTSNNGGADVTWSYDTTTKTLTISGTGAMMYYGLTTDNLHSTAPWNHLDSELEHVVINNGVTSVGAYAFSMCSKLVSVNLPASVFQIDQAAFYTSDLIRIDIPSTTAVTLADNAFSYCHDDLVIAVPSTLLGTYKDNSYWSTYAAKLVGVLSETTGFDDGFAAGNYEYSRTFLCGVASTVCLPFSVTAAQATSVGIFYSFEGIDKSGAKWEVIMQEEDPSNKVTAGLTAHTPYLFMPYIFEGKSKGDPVNLTLSGNVSSAANAGYVGWTEPGTNDSWMFMGVYYNQEWNTDPDNVYGFAAQSYDGGSYTVSPGDFVMAGAGASIAPFRAFLQCNSGSQSNAPKRRNAPAETGQLPARMAVRLVGADGIVTGIGSLATQTGEIDSNDHWYDLKGRKLNSAPNARGLYIHNGKKVIKK